ncbi:MAG: hypothetical protein ACUVWZ_05390 [Anaerolineae bacterium]
MADLDQIAEELEFLTAESLEELSRFIEYLKWKQQPGPVRVSGRPWAFDFVEHFRQATIIADHDPTGMEVLIGEAACDGDWRMALWEHPPVQGSAIVEYQVPVPSEVINLRLQFATGIRDGSRLAIGNVVAFRVFVNDWRLWSDTQHARRWKKHEIVMPMLAGDMVRIRFVTDGLGNHEWAWAVWGEPRLIGEVPK